MVKPTALRPSGNMGMQRMRQIDEFIGEKRAIHNGSTCVKPLRFFLLDPRCKPVCDGY